MVKELLKNDGESFIRSVLNNEITWIAFIVGFVWAIVSTVILPINSIQIQLAQIQVDIKTSQKNYTILTTAQSILGDRITILETEIKPLLNFK